MQYLLFLILGITALGQTHATPRPNEKIKNTFQKILQDLEKKTLLSDLPHPNEARLGVKLSVYTKMLTQMRKPIRSGLTAKELWREGNYLQTFDTPYANDILRAKLNYMTRELHHGRYPNPRAAIMNVLDEASVYENRPPNEWPHSYVTAKPELTGTFEEDFDLVTEVRTANFSTEELDEFWLYAAEWSTFDERHYGLSQTYISNLVKEGRVTDFFLTIRSRALENIASIPTKHAASLLAINLNANSTIPGIYSKEPFTPKNALNELLKDPYYHSYLSDGFALADKRIRSEWPNHAPLLLEEIQALKEIADSTSCSVRLEKAARDWASTLHWLVQNIHF